MIEAGIFLSVKLDTNTENRRGKRHLNEMLDRAFNS